MINIGVGGFSKPIMDFWKDRVFVKESGDGKCIVVKECEFTLNGSRTRYYLDPDKHEWLTIRESGGMVCFDSVDQAKAALEDIESKTKIKKTYEWKDGALTET
jgi:hypothetical protein